METDSEMPTESREEMARMVEKILSDDLTDSEIDKIVHELKKSTRCPYISNLIFYSTPALTPEGVIDEALAYRPIVLPYEK